MGRCWERLRVSCSSSDFVRTDSGFPLLVSGLHGPCCRFLSDCPSLGRQEPPQADVRVLTGHVALSISVLWGTVRCFRLIWSFIPPQARNQPLPRGTPAPLRGGRALRWESGRRPCPLLRARRWSRASQWAEGACAHTRVCPCTLSCRLRAMRSHGCAQPPRG